MLIFLVFLYVGGCLAQWWQTEKGLVVKWIPDEDSVLFKQRPLPALDLAHPPNFFQPPLRTEGRDVIDANNKRFKLASVNWYGGSDVQFIPGGLETQNRSTIADTIRRMGFNSVRLPYSDEMVMTNPLIMPHLLAANEDLIGMRALEVFEAVVTALTEAGLAVIVNNHITHAVWCCGIDPCDTSWANDNLGPLCRIQQSEDDWIEHWETIMAPLINNPLVIGADLRNEVRGVWGTMSWDRWARASERAGSRLQEMNPDWLIIVGGISSGNDLSGARDRPVQLPIPNHLIYSAHVYSWSGWGSTEGRFAKRPYASFVNTMRNNWAYLLEEAAAPVWIGEFGAPGNPGEGDAHYWQNLMKFLKAVDADFGYWAINPRKLKPDEGETYGLLEDDWTTPVLDYRMRDLQQLMNL